MSTGFESYDVQVSFTLACPLVYPWRFQRFSRDSHTRFCFVELMRTFLVGFKIAPTPRKIIRPEIHKWLDAKYKTHG